MITSFVNRHEKSKFTLRLFIILTCMSLLTNFTEDRLKSSTIDFDRLLRNIPEQQVMNEIF